MMLITLAKHRFTKRKVRITHATKFFLKKSQSSTWRELETIRYFLSCSRSKFKNTTVFWYTDNFAYILNVRKRSTKSHLHELTLEIHNLFSVHKIDPDTCWIAR